MLTSRVTRATLFIINSNTCDIETQGSRQPPFADDLPYWVTAAGEPHRVVPYTREANDIHFCNRAWIQFRRAVLQLSARQHRRALRRGRDCAEDDIGRFALQDRRPHRPLRRLAAFSRPHAEARRGVDLPARRYCAVADVREVLDHSIIRMTERYVHLAPENTRRARDPFNDVHKWLLRRIRKNPKLL